MSNPNMFGYNSSQINSNIFGYNVANSGLVTVNTTQDIIGAKNFENTNNVYFGSGANLTGIVTTNTTQTITGAKTFFNTITGTSANFSANVSAQSFTSTRAGFTANSGGIFTGDGSGLINLPTNTAPVGTIVMFASNTIPTGWLLCDGSQILIANYTALWNVIGSTYTLGTIPAANYFFLPNFKGLFTRGAGGNSYMGTSTTALGEIQEGQVSVHYHNLAAVNTDTQETTGSATVLTDITGVPGLTKTHAIVSNTVVNTTATNGTGTTDWNCYYPGTYALLTNENRPTNISINYIIKYGGADTYTIVPGTTPALIQSGSTLNIQNNSLTSGTTSIILNNASGTSTTPFTVSSTASTLAVPLTATTITATTLTATGTITASTIICPFTRSAVGASVNGTSIQLLTSTIASGTVYTYSVALSIGVWLVSGSFNWVDSGNILEYLGNWFQPTGGNTCPINVNTPMGYLTAPSGAAPHSLALNSFVFNVTNATNSLSVSLTYTGGTFTSSTFSGFCLKIA